MLWIFLQLVLNQLSYLSETGATLSEYKNYAEPCVSKTLSLLQNKSIIILLNAVYLLLT